MTESGRSFEQNGVGEVMADYAGAVADVAPNGVPPGYKQTQVGVIPEDWRIRKLGELGKWEGGSTPSMRLPGYWVNGSVPWVSSGDVKRASIRDTQHKTTDFAVKKTGIPVLPKGAILVVVRSGILRRYLPVSKIEKPMAINQDIKGIIPDPLIEPGYTLQAIIFAGPRIREVCQKAGTTVESIEFQWLKHFGIPVPKEQHEQRAIASALSDADALIDSLDRLIAKKRAIKQAAMQQLLTGETRLPGSTEEWRTKKLGDLLDRVIGGGTPSRTNPQYWDGDIPWITVKDFASFNSRGAQEYITGKGVKESATNLVPAGNVIVSIRMGLGGAVIYDVDVSINQDLKGLFCGSELTPKFLYYWFELNANLIELLGSGSTVKGLAVTDLKGLPLNLPCKDEQVAITNALSDMDEEIAALEKRRDKARQIKQGMMQELLTGRTRLVEPGAVA